MNNNWKGLMTLIGIGVVLGAILVVILVFVVGAKPTNVSIGPIVFELPVTNPSTQNPEPVALGIIKVPGNSNQGVQLKIKEAGLYAVRYKSGSYSTFPNSEISAGQKTWLTMIHIFKGAQAEWDGETLKHEAVYKSVANTGFWPSSEEAENVAQDSNVQAYFNYGEVLTLIADDNRVSYADNPGEVILEVLFVSQ
jgi:hypothetical protein